MSFSPQKKNAIIIGLGRGGIGDELAKKFSAEDYNVAMVARSDLSRLEGVIPNSKSYRCDAGDPQQVSETVKQICTDMQIDASDESKPKLDALMYNAGSGVFKPFEACTYEDFELSFKTGPGGVFLWTKACLPMMKKGSSIGLTGATASWRGMAFTPAFAPSKMATRGLAQALARDLGPSKGIHVFHVIIDGVVNVAGGPDKAIPEYLKNKPANEMLDPVKIAETYWYLHTQPENCWTQEVHLAAGGAFSNIASI